MTKSSVTSFKSNGYTLHREDRIKSGGGVGIYGSDTLKHSRWKDFYERTLEMMSIEVEPRWARSFFVVAWYRPPAEPVDETQKEYGLFRSWKQIGRDGFQSCKEFIAYGKYL